MIPLELVLRSKRLQADFEAPPTEVLSDAWRTDGVEAETGRFVASPTWAGEMAAYGPCPDCRGSGMQNEVEPCQRCCVEAWAEHEEYLRWLGERRKA